MNKTALLCHGLLAVALWLAPLSGGAMTAAGQTPRHSDAGEAASFLTGEFVAWQGNTLITTVGKFTIDSGVDLLDRAHTTGRSYADDGGQRSRRPHVQLEFQRGELRKVTIY
ncbi:MAG TPA: hypothetical protein VKA76_01800 [Gammaproteobacteria bacterium]|nr:hypothetical protein [Gammaproteobacteria bacterium]